VDRKSERAVQAKLGIFKRNKKKIWLLKHVKGRTLCAGLQMVTSSRLLINNGLSRQEESVATLCQVLHRQWFDLFMMVQSSMKFVECLNWDVSPPPILHVLSRLIESICYIQYIQSFSYTVVKVVQPYIHASIHLLTLSYVHICTRSSVHNACTTSIHTLLHQSPRVLFGHIPSVQPLIVSNGQS